MANEHACLGGPDERFHEVLLEYVEAAETGSAPAREEFLARHPEFAGELAEFFASQDQFDGLAAPLRWVAQAVLEATPVSGDTPLSPSSSGGPISSAPPTKTRSFGDYELLQKIGQGGMGVVYKAHQRSLHRLVALKMIRASSLACAADVQRFRAEAEAAASLDHPHIVPIYEVGGWDGQPYFSMKLVTGGNLMDAVTEGKLSGETKEDCRVAAQVVATVACAVHHAHQRGVLHRDLKPSNILLDRGGQPHVTDFGLSRRLAGAETRSVETSLTQTGQIVGTPGYMAPEQASGKKAAVTMATDVYGLGAVLYAVLTGRPPFRGETVLDTLTQVKEREPERPSNINRRVDRELETICLKCLEKEPERRYASAEALAEDLQRWLASKPIQARPISRTARFWRWCKRNRAIATLTGLAALLVITGLVGLLVGILLIAQKQVETEEALGQAQEQRRLAEERELDIRRQLYAADINRAARSWGVVETEQVLALLERHIPAPGQEDLRSFEWYYLQRLCQGQKQPRRTLQDGSSDVYCAVFSPDGQSLATCGLDGNVRLWNPATGQLQAKFRAHANEANAVAFSPDGQTLATASDDGTVKLWDRATGQERRQITQAAKPVVDVAFSPDGKMLAAGLDNGTLLRWELPSGRAQPPLAADSNGIAQIAFSADGTRLATAGCEGAARLWDPITGRLVNDFRQFSFLSVRTIQSVAFGRHNPWLATADAAAYVALWSTTTGRRLVTLRGHQAETQSVAFSPDDRLLASADNDGTVRLWEMPSGKLCNLLAGHAERVWCVAFAPDGRTLATASRDGTVKLWDPELRYDSRVLDADWNIVDTLAFSPDSRTLATSGYDAQVRFWDAATGHLQGLFPHKGRVTPQAFSPDGKTLACIYLDGVARLWDVSRQEERCALQAGESPVSNLDFSRDGGKLLTNILKKGPVRIWEVRSGTRPTIVASLGISEANAALAPDGRLVATTSPLGVQLWELPGGILQQVSSQPTTSDECLAFSPDSGTLATAGGLIRLWDVSTGRLITTTGVSHRNYRGNYRAVAFSPDGRTLASCSLDGAVTLWNVPTGQELLTLERPNCRFWSVAFSPDGRSFAAGGELPQSAKGLYAKGFCQLWLAADEPRPPEHTVTK